MNQESLEWAAFALQEYERKKCIAKVLNFDSEPAVAKGDNYASEIRRIKLEVLLNSGDVEQRSYVYKSLPKNEEAKQIVKKSQVFIKESKAFSEVLEAMDKIVQKFEPGSEPFNARFIGSKGNGKIIFEDLKPYGYTIAKGRKGLNFTHCILVLRTLAKLHALGAVLIETGELFIDEYNICQFEKNRHFYDQWFRNSLKALSWILETRWRGEWLQYSRRLKKAAETIGNELCKLYKREESRFNTFLHGDCNINNLMFRYDHEGNPVAVRFVDFQISFYNSVGFDLNFFLWVCPDTDVRPRKGELIKLYHESLSRHMRLYGFAKEPPSLEDVVADVERTALFGLAISITFLEYQMQARSGVPGVDGMTSEKKINPDGISSMKRNPKKTEDFERTMQYVIKEAVLTGLI